MHKICLRMHIPAGNYMLKVNNRHTRTRCKKAWKKLGFQLPHKRPHIVEDQNLTPRFPISGWSKFDFLMIHATNEQKWWAGLGTFILFEVKHEFSMKEGSNLFRGRGIESFSWSVWTSATCKFTLIPPEPHELRPTTLLKKGLYLRYFPVNFVKCLGTTFLQNTSGRLLPKLADNKNTGLIRWISSKLTTERAKQLQFASFWCNHC